MLHRPFHFSVSSGPRITRLGRTIMLSVVLLLALMAAILGQGLYLDHRNILRSAGERLQTQLRAFGSATDIALLSAEHALSRSSHELEQHSGQPLSGLELRRLLLHNLARAPALSRLALFDDKGSLVATAGEDAGTADMPPWVAAGLRAGSRSFSGIAQGQLGVALRVSAPGAGGVLLALLDQERIAAELESGDGFEGQHLMLLDMQNRSVLLAGAGPHQQTLLRQLQELQAPGEFSGFGTQLVQGQDYLFAIRQLSQQPVRAFSAIERSRVLHGWYLRVAISTGVLLLVLVLTALFLRQWRNSSRRERQIMNDLAHLHQAIEQMPSPIVITDLNRCIVYVNQAFLAHTGYSGDEVLGMKPNMLSSGRTPPATYRALWRELKREQPWQGEFINRMRDGSERIESVMITPVRDLDGRIASYFAISQDVTGQHEAAARLVRYKEIVNAADELMALVSPDYHYLQVNNRYLEYHHRERNQIEGHSMQELYGETEFNQQIKPLFDGAVAGRPFVIEQWLTFAGKGRRFCRISGHPVADTRQNTESVAINIADFTERKLMEEALRTSERRFRVLSEFSPMGIFEADAEGHNIYSNRYYSDVLGQTTEQLMGDGWTHALHPDDKEKILNSWHAAVAGQKSEWRSEGRFLDAEGRPRWFRFAARRVEGTSFEEVRYIGMAVDITEQVQHREILEQKNRELERLSTTDALTGLINRGRTEQMLAEEIHRYHRYGTSFGLIMLDVDHFKQVNDTCGHEVGDQVLCRLAKLMQEHTRLSDCPGRWGGEEFLILCPNTDLKGVQQLAEALRERIANEDFPVIGQRTCSFGVTVIGPGDNAKALLVRADEALYRAKSGGRNRVEVA
ncbi:PAS domain S-box protein [Oceanimonas sp. CAM02]|uniref:sensor domain-containing diguanylate cyclase n=1 Tax=Oceanimonas sp. CAM02 TaxID=3080336 RepID=UPI00293659B6|nr:PAS domain S-box protein [Oceanimonas sp. CAM02]MDV2857732.1 PAS domain S-box protein [Oceanimonas sp. CAM02]